MRKKQPQIEYTVRLEDRVDNVTSERRTCTKDCRVSELSSNLLAHLSHLAAASLGGLLGLLSLGLGGLGVRDGHGRCRVVVRVGVVLLLLRGVAAAAVVAAGLALGRAGVVGVVAGRLFVGVAVVDGLGLDVVAGEDALAAGAQVAAHPPVGVHVPFFLGRGGLQLAMRVPFQSSINNMDGGEA